MLVHRSLWLQVRSPPSSPTRGMGWLRKTPVSYNSCMTSSRVCFEMGSQARTSSTSAVGGDNLEVSTV
jgi:hypothetical protein